MSGSTRDRDIGTRDGDQWTLPLLVREGRRALEGDCRAVGEVGHVEGGTSWHLDAVEGNGLAPLFAGDGACCVCEAAALLDVLA